MAGQFFLDVGKVAGVGAMEPSACGKAGKIIPADTLEVEVSCCTLQCFPNMLHYTLQQEILQMKGDKIQCPHYNSGCRVFPPYGDLLLKN